MDAKLGYYLANTWQRVLKKLPEDFPIEVCLLATGFLVVKPVYAHINFLKFLGSVVERRVHVLPCCDHYSHVGSQYQTIGPFDSFGCYPKYFCHIYQCLVMVANIPYENANAWQP